MAVRADRTVVLTGASRGIGEATAGLLVAADVNVVLVTRDDVALDRLVERIDPSGIRTLKVAADVTHPASADDIVQATLRRFGRLDVLVNNAATPEPIGLLAHADIGRWREHLELNLLAPIGLVAAALPSVRAVGGTIVNVVSMAAMTPVAASGAYCGSKAALAHLTRVLAIEEPGVAAVAFDPGGTDTDMMVQVRRNADAMPAETAARYRRLKEEGLLHPAIVPAQSLARVCTSAVGHLSGRLITWDADEIDSAELAWPVG